MEAVAAALDHVASHEEAVRKVDDNVPRPNHGVLEDLGGRAVPEANPIPAAGRRKRLALDPVFSNQGPRRALEVDPVEDVLEPVADDPAARRLPHHDAGVLLLHVGAGGPNHETLQPKRGERLDDVTGASPVYDRPAFSFEGERPIDDEPLGVRARADEHRVSGARRSDGVADRRELLAGAGPDRLSGQRSGCEEASGERPGDEGDEGEEAEPSYSRSGEGNSHSAGVVLRRRNHSQKRITGPNAPAANIRIAPALG